MDADTSPATASTDAEPTAAPAAVATTERPPSLVLAGIWKRYPGVDALKDVSFDVGAGEIHALLGENGAGKSTLMGVAAGEVRPDAGTISVAGETFDQLLPALAHKLRIAIVHQHPALLPDLTVAENMYLGVPEELRESNGSARTWAQAQLDHVGCTADLSARVEDVSVAQRQLIELAKALALDPQVLILDEPTAPLGPEMVDRLFGLVRGAAARGTAIVYISHRLPEVRAIAQRVTVLRDGATRATAPVEEISDDELLALIVGRSISAAFPDKKTATVVGPPGLTVTNLSGHAFHDVALRVEPGEIVGLAGIQGNGQREFLRALAGLEKASGEARIGDRRLPLGQPKSSRDAGVSYVSADRHHEGLLSSMSVRENAALSALPQFARRGVVSRAQEVAAVEQKRTELNIRAPSIETDVAALSGGNQQKVVLARALLAKPSLLLVDEPTQGVDAGARIEIYRILREIASAGVLVIVLSSDGLELEGLCDRVAIFSRGHVVRELTGPDVTEHGITEAMLTATTHRRAAEEKPASRLSLRVRRFVRGDLFPSFILVLAILGLGIYTASVNDRVLSAFNIGSALTLLSALALISFGQLMVIITGGIDISVGPLAGLLVVVASFFIVDGSAAPKVILGFLAMFGVAICVGVVNGSLIRFGRFTAVAATLATFIALQGVSLLLRETREGSIMRSVADAVEARIGAIPVVFIIVVVLALLLEYLLQYSRWGLALRASGSYEEAARRLGVRVGATVVGAYVLTSLFTFLGAILLMAQIGIGDPDAGVEYTLWSVTAVVLGGASLFGGRGSFIGALLGAALIQQILNATVFLELSQEWQFWLLGLMTLVAAGIYSQARRTREVT